MANTPCQPALHNPSDSPPQPEYRSINRRASLVQFDCLISALPLNGIPPQYRQYTDGFISHSGSLYEENQMAFMPVTQS